MGCKNKGKGRNGELGVNKFWKTESRGKNGKWLTWTGEAKPWAKEGNVYKKQEDFPPFTSENLRN